MAIWEAGPLVANISGRLAGVTFAQGAGGRVLRMAASHRRPNPGVNSEFVRRILEIRRAAPSDYPGGLALWRAIANQLTWTDRFGAVRPCTPRQAFVRFQSFWYARTSQAAFLTPAMNQRSFVFSRMQLTPLPNNVGAIVDFPTLPNTALAEFHGRYRAGAGNARPGPWAFLQTEVFSQGTTQKFTPLSSAWASRFGPLPSKFELEIRVRAAFTVPRSFPSAWLHATGGTA